jgi:hypothetical protein
LNISGTGNILQSALVSLKENILSPYEDLGKTSTRELGKLVLMQKQILQNAIIQKNSIVNIYVCLNAVTSNYNVFTMLVSETADEPVPGHEEVEIRYSKQEAFLLACDWAEVLFWDKNLSIANIHCSV